MNDIYKILEKERERGGIAQFYFLLFVEGNITVLT